MKKETFINLIEAIQEQRDKNSEFEEKIASFFDGHSIFTFSDTIIQAIINGLESEMNDPGVGTAYGSIIYWWLYDAPGAGNKKDSAWIEDKNGIRIQLETSIQLYDYLVSCDV
jgi:hypothetical protein